jgi:hypothetical protein
VERPKNLASLANQLNDIVSELVGEDGEVGTGKTFDKETKKSIFCLFAYCKTSSTATLLRKEIGDAYESLPVVYRQTWKTQKA